MRKPPGILLAVLLTVAWSGASAPVAQEPSGVSSVQPASIAELRSWDARIETMRRDGDLRVRRVFEDALLPGRVHERLDQYYRGVRVFGGDVARQSANGQTVSIVGTVYPGIDLDPSPRLAPSQAAAVVARLTGRRLVASRMPELMVLPRAGGGYALTYRARIVTAGDIVVYFLDANTGDVVLQYSDLQTQSAVGKGVGVLGDSKKLSVFPSSGQYLAEDRLRPPLITTYDLKGSVSRVMDFLNGYVSFNVNDIASDPDNDWQDGPTVDAHVHAGWTYDYYYKRFNRSGLDDRNVPMRSLVHPVRRTDLTSQPSEIVSLFYLNAFYAGDGVMVYGEGLPPGFVVAGSRQTVDYFAAALDIVAHELTHGVTDYTSSLIYLNESGALNEAFSDIMATGVEFFYQPPGSGLDQADYLVGEDVFRPGGIRSLSNPAAFGDPDHYSQRYTGTADNGGVHINSGIANQAFYMAIEGGTNRTSGLSVQGVGGANREQIEKIFYRAFTLLLPSNATFSMARGACEQAASDLYGPSSAAFRAIQQAWIAVGVS